MNAELGTYRRGRVLAGIAGAVLVALAVGITAYNAGVAHGLGQQIAALPAGTYPYPHAWPHPWGFGLFFPLLFGFLLLRVIFGGFGHRHWHRERGCYGRDTYGVHPAFEEWHRRAHERAPQDSAPNSV